MAKKERKEESIGSELDSKRFKSKYYLARREISDIVHTIGLGGGGDARVLKILKVLLIDFWKM